MLLVRRVETSRRTGWRTLPVPRKFAGGPGNLARGGFAQLLKSVLLPRRTTVQERED
jgi:hypothetical protein